MMGSVHDEVERCLRSLGALSPARCAKYAIADIGEDNLRGTDAYQKLRRWLDYNDNWIPAPAQCAQRGREVMGGWITALPEFKTPSGAVAEALEERLEAIVREMYRQARVELPPSLAEPPKPDHICTHCGDEDARNGICESCWFGYDRARGLVNGCECERCEMARESER